MNSWSKNRRIGLPSWAKPITVTIGLSSESRRKTGGNAPNHIHPETAVIRPVAEFVHSIWKEHQPQAIGALQFLTGKINQTTEGFLGAIRAAKFLLGDTEANAPYFANLQSTLTALQESFRIQQKEHKDFLKAGTLDLDQKNTKYLSLETTLEKAVTDTSSKLVSLEEKAKNDFDAITESYNQKMAMRAPLSYWARKANDHKNRRRWVFWTLAIFAAISTMGLVFLLIWLIEDYTTTVLPLPITGLIVVATGVALWIGRILVKLFLSNLHLEIDALERVTMVETYLSLLQEKAGFSEGDKKLILAALFRPANTGLLKGDLSSPHWLGLLDTFIGGKS